MPNYELLKRIVINPKIMAGKPVIRGTRLTVQYVLGLLAQGATVHEVLIEYPGLCPVDIYACFHYASESLDQTTVLPLLVEST